MTDKNIAKEWLVAISNDDYVKADEIFPKLVNSSLQTLINNRKPAIIEQLNAKAESIASSAVEHSADNKT